MAAPSKKINTGIVIKTGLLTGTLDIAIALIQYYSKTGKDPANVLRFIAGAVFGSKAYAGGTGMAVAGLLFHFAIALVWTIIFFFLYPKIALLQKNFIVSAIIYGVFIWAVMNFIVLPLSALPALHSDLKQSLTAIAILVIAFGIPLSLISKRYFR